MESKHQKTCFDCTHAMISPPDYSIGIKFPSVEDCARGNTPEVQALFDESESQSLSVQRREAIQEDPPEKWMARKCSYFDPVIVSECCHCHKPINEPRWSWKLWAICWDAQPACSVKCKEQAEEAFQREFEGGEGYAPDS